MLMAMKDATLRQLHCNFIASLAKKAALAKPTVFHNFMSLLNENKVLKRLYTQNIDGLESKAGFEILDDLCIPLHGTLSTLRCETCKFTKPLENYFHFLKAGNIPQCNKDRNSERLRDKTCGGFLYPDILLYEEESPNGDFVAMCANSDSQKIAKTKSSVVLVAGTSLQIPGVVGIIKGMKKAADVKGATLIYIDLNSNLPKALSNIFNLCLQVDCQEFAQAAIDALKGAEGKDRERERIEEDVIVDGQRRRDLRPLWSWI